MLPALIVGALTAWYLGLRMGIIVALIVAAALFVAMFVPVPGVTWAVYGLVIAWAAALWFLGPKLSKRSPGLFGGVGGITGAVGGAASQAKGLVNKFLNRNQG
jgi:hypothetical protein